ncbi:recombinase family protein [Prochlorococcus marinus]|uniref:recombinase family protein n=1 Tax=Prochlorococcus marinus TaxID=1219 RepID=UPI0012DA8E9D
MVLRMMASVAEFEARRISERTKEALAAAKARGGVLGDTGQVQPSSLLFASRRLLRRSRICVEFSSQLLVQV